MADEGKAGTEPPNMRAFTVRCDHRSKTSPPSSQRTSTSSSTRATMLCVMKSLGTELVCAHRSLPARRRSHATVCCLQTSKALVHRNPLLLSRVQPAIRCAFELAELFEWVR